MYIAYDVVLLLIFFVHCAIAASAYYVCTNKLKYSDYILSIFIVLFFILLVFTRGGLGSDEPTYRNAYIEFLTSTDNIEFEFAYKWLMYIFYSIDIDASSFNNAVCFLYLILTWIVSLVLIRSPYRSLFIMFFLFSSVSLDFLFNVYRQGFATLFVLLTLGLYERNRKLLAVIMSIIAIGFHWTTLVFFIICISSKILKKKSSTYLISIVVTLTILAFIYPLGVLSVLSNILLLLPFESLYIEKINFYLNSGVSTLYDLNVVGRSYIAINTIAALFFIRIYYNNISPYLINLILFLSIYCLLFIEISYSFRNYYWVFSLFPYIVIFALSNIEQKDCDITPHVLVFCFAHIIMSIVTFYTSPVIPQVFLVSLLH